jgi:signal transduction histidine kinase
MQYLGMLTIGYLLSICFYHYYVFSERKNEKNILHLANIVLLLSILLAIKLAEKYNGSDNDVLIVSANYIIGFYFMYFSNQIFGNKLIKKKLLKILPFIAMNLILYIYLYICNIDTTLADIINCLLGIWGAYFVVLLSKNCITNKLLIESWRKYTFLGLILFGVCFTTQAILASFFYSILTTILIMLGSLSVSVFSTFGLAKKFNNEFKELEQLKNHLEEKVSERTKELEIANEQKTDAFINVAHEIKTPLTIINNSLNRYKSQASDDEFLREISYNVDVLLKNANDFIDTEKLTGGKSLYIHDSSIDFSSLLLQKTSSFWHLAGNNGITIEHDIEDDIIIKADPVAIDRVLNNLLYNAIHYNRPSGSIFVTLKKTDTNVTLIVKDTGIGISQEHQQHIFEPYYQVSHKKKNSQGIGMGLYITSEIVRSLDGTIEVESSEGKGSSFIVNLKAFSDSEHADAIVADVTEPLDFPVYTEISDIIHDTSDFPVLLVVEDKKSLLKAIRDYMSDSFDVLCAINGKVAIDKITSMQKIPDCIISDIMMDEMDGFEFLETIRNDQRLNAVPFIFLTAKSSDSEKVEGLQKGATAYIAKPFSMDVLRAKINSMLEYNTLKQKVFELEKYRSIGVMTASICHQILNPLAGIRGPIYVIEKAIEKAGAGNEKIDKNILFIKENSNRINEIVDTLRSLFKGYEFAVEEIRVKQYISSMVALFAEKVSDKIEFSIEIDENLTIQMNKGALTQIMINLLSNAVEAIHAKGKILITVNKQLISIKDNGCGIPEEHFEKVFDLHYTTKPEGTGFGMYLVKQLVERLGITIQLQSVVGEGTEVVLEFGKKCVPAL